MQCDLRQYYFFRYFLCHLVDVLSDRLLQLQRVPRYLGAHVVPRAGDRNHLVRGDSLVLQTDNLRVSHELIFELGNVHRHLFLQFTQCELDPLSAYREGLSGLPSR